MFLKDTLHTDFDDDAIFIQSVVIFILTGKYRYGNLQESDTSYILPHHFLLLVLAPIKINNTNCPKITPAKKDAIYPITTLLKFVIFYAFNSIGFHIPEYYP